MGHGEKTDRFICSLTTQPEGAFTSSGTITTCLYCSVSPHTHSSLCCVKAVVSEAPNPQIPISPSGPSRAVYPLLLSDPFKCSHSSPPRRRPACKGTGGGSTAIQRLSFGGSGCLPSPSDSRVGSRSLLTIAACRRNHSNHHAFTG